MKLKYLLRTVLLVFSIASLCMEGLGQPWTYDFGTGTGSFTSSTASTTFLPTPPSGTARDRDAVSNFRTQPTPFDKAKYLGG